MLNSDAQGSLPAGDVDPAAKPVRRSFTADYRTAVPAEYNHVHHHSGIGWHTPASVHHSTCGAIDDARAATLDRARREHPDHSTNDPGHPRSANKSGSTNHKNRSYPWHQRRKQPNNQLSHLA